MADKNTPDFNFDKVVKDDANLEPFRIVLGGKVREFRHLDELDSVAFSLIGKGTDSDWKLIEMATDSDTYQALRDARPKVGQVKKLARAYAEFCLGEDATGE